ncbi:hypothetical protein CDD83_6949 [Cordyceps sp. RAO-2017]|nr:hypothetical protein CDD83_6949 [Cordyceps sp. RAO-2017]
MSAALSRRQQARNEKLLRDLVQSVPGNNRCADCHMPSPAWASWSLGVFLCMRCASIHRKLGTHISKVKSLSMDSWSNEQVDNMRKVGNVVSNQVYNPDNKRPPIPIDADEADSAMERFIRQKYVTNVANELGKPRSPRSDEGTPPPLPPKNSTKFGFRSASSIFPLSSRAKKEAKMAAVLGARSNTSPGLTNKPSKVFGATVDLDEPDDTEKKLAKLRSMGFQDAQRNAIVLKGVNGSLERAIGALVRLGEGAPVRSDDVATSPVPAAMPRENTLRVSRSLTPMTSGPAGAIVGLSAVPQNAVPERPTTASTMSTWTNPLDMMATQPQTAHSTGSLQHKNPYSGVADVSTNPFGYMSPPGDAVSQAFQGLTVSAPQQSLFPHRTGDVGIQQQSVYQQYVSPSAPTSPVHHQSVNLQGAASYGQQQQQASPGGYNNPFLTQASQMQSPSPRQNLPAGASPTQGGYANNPFARSPTRIASPALGQIPEQSQTTTFLTASPQPLPTNTNPFFVNAMQTGQPSAGQVMVDPHHMLNQLQAQYQPPRHDKASIMALYNRPYQASAQPAAPEPQAATQAPEGRAVYRGQPAGAVPATDPRRSVSQPLPAATNPFMTNGARPDPLSSGRHSSRDSMNLGMDMAWANGRHSPDAFASLSARHV